MGVCKNCGAEIPDGKELCNACQQKELDQSEAYLDELLGAMQENADDMSGLQLSPKLDSDALTAKLAEEMNQNNPVMDLEEETNPDALMIESEEVNLDTLTADIEDEIDLDALLEQAEKEINLDILPEEPEEETNAVDSIEETEVLEDEIDLDALLAEAEAEIEADAPVIEEEIEADAPVIETEAEALEDEIDLDALLAEAEAEINTDAPIVEEEAEVLADAPVVEEETEVLEDEIDLDALLAEAEAERNADAPVVEEEVNPDIPMEEVDVSALLTEAKEEMDVDALLAEAEEEVAADTMLTEEENEIDLDALLAEAEETIDLDALDAKEEGINSDAVTAEPDEELSLEEVLAETEAELEEASNSNTAEEERNMEEKEYKADSSSAGSDEEEDVNEMLNQMLEDLDNSGNLQMDAGEPEVGVSDEELSQLMENYTGSEEEAQDLDGLLSMLEVEGDDEEEPLALDAMGEQEESSEGAGSEDAVDVPVATGEEYIAVPEEEAPKRKGFFARIFGNIITDEIAEKERADAAKEQEALAKKEEQKEKQKAADEEKKAKKAEADEEKKAEKARLKEEKKLAKAAKKAEKAAKKAEEEAAEAAVEIQGQLNKVGVSIVAVLAVAFLLFVLLGTRTFSYSTTIKEANRYFGMQKYTKAYNEILGVEVKDKDKELYDKIITVMHVNREIDSYNLYTSMKKYPEALDALIKGLKNYDSHIETAKDLEVEKDMEYCRGQITSYLQENYGLSEDEARQIMAVADKEQYSKSIVDTVLRVR